jgi:wyosine [tRNA(Phe)-imidazoG37] synthetase (radical SAM superfamily)
MNFSEEERAEFEEQLADVDPKVVQIQMLMELKAIRNALEEPQERSESETLYLCESCGDKVPAEKRQSHAQERHNAPKLPVEDYGLFSKV